MHMLSSQRQRNKHPNWRFKCFSRNVRNRTDTIFNCRLCFARKLKSFNPFCRLPRTWQRLLKTESKLFVNIVRHASTNLNTAAENCPSEWSRTARVLACVVVFGVVLQSFFLAGLRTAERAHFHSAPASMPSSQSPDANENGHPHTHTHTHAAIHDHGSDRNDVVYVSSDDGDDTPLPALTRLPLDLDGYFLKADLPFIARQRRVVFIEPPSHFGSRTELPLERPPRIRA